MNPRNHEPSPNNQFPPTLPDWCYTVLPSSGALIIVERDVNGYGRLPESSDDPQLNRKLATEYNTRMDVTPQQEAAMLGGSMFGWETPAARLANYNEQGEPLSPTQHQEAMTAEETTESRFLNTPADSYAIFQLKQTDETRDLRYESLERVQRNGMTVDRANYECVYTAQLHGKTPTFNLLHELYEQFNLDHPADFTGCSMSVSDVVALKQDGQITCHYVDRWSFVELPAFLQPENALKNAEMSMEDDYGMIDGLINNGKSPATKDQEKLPAPTKDKPSVLAQLKAKPDSHEHNIKSAHKSVNRGMER